MPLAGRRVLVVEDCYYTATDTAAALRDAGASVLGPCSDETTAWTMLEEVRPSHAILDLNLGVTGPRFRLAYALRRWNVPFLFFTGYDTFMIPADLAAVSLLQKPLAYQAVAAAVARI